ncbi:MULTISPECIES: MBL fold metallo-hydrolase [unclassified Kitasatospora]|uniref:MBL fold metallo-hydrolase n=1 Tax=unclassified Kitasatospora TaxID=2633591 RepID=UPI0034454818
MANFEADAAHRDERLRRPSGIRSVQLGDTKVTFVPDGVVLLPPRGWLPETTDRTWAERPQYLDASGQFVATVGALLVEHAGRALLIDAGFGPRSLPADPSVPHGPGHGGALLDNLAELGRRPDDIEAVAFTHLHSDHTGWAWHPAPGGDRPAFAHADYLVSEAEWAGHLARPDGPGAVEGAAVLAPRVRTVAHGQEVFPGVRVHVGAGHTPGHAEYTVTAGGQRLIAFGDAMHSPVQVDHPEWSVSVDHDPARAVESRRRLVAELAEPDTIGFGVHFADVVFGRVRHDGPGPAWHPLDA